MPLETPCYGRGRFPGMMLLEESEVAAKRFDQELALHFKFLSWVGRVRSTLLLSGTSPRKL
jgi:hypothetical protein